MSPYLVYQRKWPGQKDQAWTGAPPLPPPTPGEGGGRVDSTTHDAGATPRLHRCACVQTPEIGPFVTLSFDCSWVIFNNKTVTYTVSTELPKNSRRQSLYLRSLWEPLNLQPIGPKRGWASNTCGWSLEWDGLVEDWVREPVWSTLTPGSQYQDRTESQDTSWCQNSKEATR